MQKGADMKELTYEEFCQSPMHLVMHISGEKEHYLHKACAPEIGVSSITITRVKKNGEFGKSTRTFHLKDDKRLFTTVDQVYVAYMEKACGVKS